MIAAIATHIAKVGAKVQGTTEKIAGKYVVPDDYIPNTGDGPTLETYIQLEASDGYLATALSDSRIVTTKVSDLLSG